MSEKFKKILILRLSALGDTIHTLPVAHALKKTYPNCEIGWVVEDKAKLFIDGNPLVDHCYVIPKKQWKQRGFSFQNISEFKSIIDNINAQNYDVVLDTQQLLKSSFLLPFLNIKRKVTLSGGREFSWLFSNEFVKSSHSLFDPNYHVVNRNLELAKYLGADVSDVRMTLKPAPDEVVSKINDLLSGLDINKKTIIISPATTWVNKHWAENHWHEVIRYFCDKVNLVFTGMDSDLPLINRILGDINSSSIFVLAGKTNLIELAEVFRRGDVVISPDSGSAHIAWATQKSSIVTLFCATAEKRSAPFGENCYVLSPQLPCRPCLKRKCHLTSDKNKCCSLVQPRELIDLLNIILNK